MVERVGFEVLSIKKDAIVASHTILDLLEKGGKLVF
jgi:hypothetical protein